MRLACTWLKVVYIIKLYFELTKIWKNFEKLNISYVTVLRKPTIYTLIININLSLQLFSSQQQMMHGLALKIKNIYSFKQRGLIITDGLPYILHFGRFLLACCIHAIFKSSPGVPHNLHWLFSVLMARKSHVENQTWPSLVILSLFFDSA